jgi:chromosome segregation protein
MRLKSLEVSGFKSFVKKTVFDFGTPIAAIVGPNGSGKSNAAEALRFVLGEKSLKSLRGTRGEDLIWHGSPSAPRANRASASLILDNRDRKFPLDYDEVTLTREVHRDGTNVYSVNGSVVRLRDLTELLTKASLAVADHLIISQGEADRLLLASPTDRRALIEDALGLRLYQWKIAESEKKLTETEANCGQAAALRREIGPHLRFLTKQMEKLAAASRWREELRQCYQLYLSAEHHYLKAEAARLGEEEARSRAALAKLDPVADGLAPAPARSNSTLEIENSLAGLAREKEELNRRLGQLEGRLEARPLPLKAVQTGPAVSATEALQLARELESLVVQAERLTDLYSVRGILAQVKKLIADFLSGGAKPAAPEPAGNSAEREKWEAEKRAAETRLTQLLAEEASLHSKRQAWLAEINKELAQQAARLEARLAGERERAELVASLRLLQAAREKLNLEKLNWENERREAAILVGELVNLETNPEASASREAQAERRKQIERLKLRLEDAGADDGQLRREHEEVASRDAHLEREIADLEKASASLREIIKNLREQIAVEFTAGLGTINAEFQNFFSLLFNGGTAGLDLIKMESGEEGEPENKEVKEAGLDIKINLPRKKVRSLEMLSGGERALVSIALLFAVSRVNPPPFLVLDETDAALDEANSRRYGDMIESLAQHSQLVLITHNRETMSRAGIIYGVTMGGDGVSRLLSIKLDDAVSYAK